MKEVWTPAARDRLRWACLGQPSIDRTDAMQRLAKDLGVSWAELTTQASGMNLLFKGPRRDPA